MEKIFVLSPLLFGDVVGFIIFYFIRKSDRYTAKQLKLTLSIFLSGIGGMFILSFLGKNIGTIVYLFYLLGIPLRIVLYIFYLIILALIFKKEFISPSQKYNMLASCNLSSEEKEHGALLYEKCDKLNKCFRLWLKNKLSDEEFTECISKSDLTKNDYEKYAKKNHVNLCLIANLYML